MSLGKRRCIFAIFPSIRRWIWAGTVAPARPARWRTIRSGALPNRETPLVRGQDAELLPVLRDRSSRDGEAFLAQGARDVLVGQGLRELLLRHEVLDHLLDADRGHLVTLAFGD